MEKKKGAALFFQSRFAGESAVIAAMYNKERGHATVKLTGSIRE